MFNFQINNRNLILLLILITSLLSSCSSDRIAKCREIITIAVNIDQKTKDNLKNQNPKDILAVADFLATNSEKIKNIELKDQQLKQYKEQLSNIYQEYADATRNFIQAFKDKDVDQAIYYKEQITKLFEQQQQLVTDMNNYCQP